MNAVDEKKLVEAERLLSEGRHKDALSRLFPLTEKYPDDTKVRRGIASGLAAQGLAKAERGHLDAAASDFERSLRYADNAEAHVRLGQVRQAQGQLDDAFAELSRALEMDDENATIHEALGHYFLARLDFEQAANAFGRSLSKGGTARSCYLGLWEAYMGLNRHEQAHETALDAGKLYPEDDAVLGTVGLSFAVACNDHDSAEIWWRKAVERNPKNLPALFNLAGLAALRGQRDAALGYIRQCVDVDRVRTLEMWREDAHAPRRKFAAFVGDEDFLDLLGVTV